MPIHLLSIFFFFNDTATTEIYTLSLHDALPILVDVERERGRLAHRAPHEPPGAFAERRGDAGEENEPGAPHRLQSTDRKSTRLNSSHSQISYAVFCLKKKKKQKYSIELDEK